MHYALGTGHWALGTGVKNDALDPTSSAKCQVPSAIIIGPEGGFIPFEIDAFRKAGCRVVTLGERVLRVETAVVALLAKMF